MLESDVLALERAACVPEPLNVQGFNAGAILPHGLTSAHIQAAMQDFLDILRFLNDQLYSQGLTRLEAMLMTATFSSIVSEFCVTAIPRHCPSLVKNEYHNGHPDLLPAGMYPGDSIQYGHEGIEVKASRYPRGWQGHNSEASWLMVFTFTASRSSDSKKGIQPSPFRFDGVYGAQLELSDWTFSGRLGTSRRTITASVKRSGRDKMISNWIYRR